MVMIMGPIELVHSRLIHGFVILTLLLSANSGEVMGQEAADPFGSCEADFAAHRNDWNICGCFYQEGQKRGLQIEAARRLTDHLRDDPDNPCLLFYLGIVRVKNGEEGAIELLLKAARQYAARQQLSGECYARKNLARHLSDRGQRDEAWTQLEMAIAAAAKGDDPILLTLELERARLLLEDGEDLRAVDRLMRGLEARIFPAGSENLKRDFLLAMTGIHFLMGHYDEAERCQDRLLALAESTENLFSQATAQLNLAIIHMARPPRRGARERAIQLLRKTLTAARTAHQRGAEIEAHIRLGRLLKGEEGREHLEAGVLIAREFGDPAQSAGALRALASDFLKDDPSLANQYIVEAQRSARAAASPWVEISGWADEWRVSWAGLPPQGALDRSLATLDLIDQLRDLQRAQGSRAEMFAAWTEAYYWLSGHLLESATSNEAKADLTQAWTITERMRARVLLEALDSSPQSVEENAPAEWRKKHEDLLKAKVGVNRRLLDPSLPAEERSAALEELRELELREAELRDDLQESAPSRVRDVLERHAFATLDQLEARLHENEALFSFQIAPWEDIYGDFAGGSWLLVSTRQGTRTYKLSTDFIQLKQAVKIFSGLFVRRDDPPTAVLAANLFEQLLATAIADLPPAVNRLVIIPDGILHRLPFAVLHGLDEKPLAARYQLSIVPSATLWSRFRQAETVSAEIPALALIDPLPAGATDALPAEKRAWSLSEGARLGRLPYARREGRSIGRHLGSASRRLIGAEASERAVKEFDLAKIEILHFAAHAVLDDEYPARSAIVLAPGSETEDGLLQPSEIAQLDLEGKVIVLSACQSASGALLQGEGVFSLARAFFEAGAHTVVGSLWPLRDDHAATLFGAFYDHLGQGKSVAEALAEAQRERIDDGASAASWAGVVALGHADKVPFPNGAGTTSWSRWLFVLVASLVLILIAFRIRGTRAKWLDRPRKVHGDDRIP